MLFFTLAYRLSPFHPLAKYPGPLMAKSSKWWAAYININGDLHRYYRDAHDRYGDVIRIGLRHLLLVASSQLTFLQDPTSSLFATLALFIPFSAEEAFPEDHVCTPHLYRGRLLTCDD